MGENRLIERLRWLPGRMVDDDDCDGGTGDCFTTTDRSELRGADRRLIDATDKALKAMIEKGIRAVLAAQRLGLMPASKKKPPHPYYGPTGPNPWYDRFRRKS